MPSRVLIYAHNDPRGVKRYVRYAVEKLAARNDLVAFLTPSGGGAFDDGRAMFLDLAGKVRVVRMPARTTTEQKYFRAMKSVIEVASATSLTWADDSILYLADPARLYDVLGGRSDWWTLSVSRLDQVQAEKQFVHFDRETPAAVRAYFAGISPTGDKATDRRLVLPALTDHLQRKGLSLGALIRPKGLTASSVRATLYHWKDALESEFPLLDADLVSRRWRLAHFGMALGAPYTPRAVYRLLKPGRLDPTLDVGAVLREAAL